MPLASSIHCRPRRLVAFSILFISGCTILCTSRCAGQQEKGTGVTLSAETSAKDVGLPLYPGSRRHVDKDEDSPGANFSLWGGGSGFKLAVLKMESGDSVEKIANYYKQALARYGAVLDCSHPSMKGTNTDKNVSENELTCGDDKAEKGGMLYKSGTKKDQHLVAIQPNAAGSLFQLVHMAHWDADNKK